jgi:uncharacterized protein YyaL (SSP411 family)
VNVLIQRMEPAEGAARLGHRESELARHLAEDREMLTARRNLRPRPHLDDKIVTAWNGLMIGALARAAQVLGEPEFLRAAQRAAGFLREKVFVAETNELRRSYREGPSAVPGFAADYAFLIHGLIELYGADFDPRWLRWARSLQDTLDLQFWDQLRGGYFSTTDRDPAILLRLKEDYDGAEPAPTSVAALNLWRFGQYFHNAVLVEHARHAVRAFAARLEAQPFGMPLLLAAGALVETPAVQLILHASDPGQPGLAELVAEARRRYLPQLVVIRVASAAERAFFAGRHPVVEKLPEKPEAPTAYLCEDFVCQLPVTGAEELGRMLAAL